MFMAQAFLTINSSIISPVTSCSDMGHGTWDMTLTHESFVEAQGIPADLNH